MTVYTRDQLDDYEKELLDSGDPADEIALKIRLKMKEAGVDPDGEWTVIRSSGPLGGDDVS